MEKQTEEQPSLESSLHARETGMHPDRQSVQGAKIPAKTRSRVPFWNSDQMNRNQYGTHNRFTQRRDLGVCPEAAAAKPVFRVKFYNRAEG